MDPALWEILKTGNPDEEIEAIIRLDDGEKDPKDVRVISRFGPIATCRIRRSSILSVRGEAAVRSLKASRPLSPDLELDEGNTFEMAPEVRYSDRRRSSGLSYTGKDVVIGVVDWGPDPVHNSFRHTDGTTRLLALWDQGQEPSHKSHNKYGYGRVYSQRQINHALQTRYPYRALGRHPAESDPQNRGSHGVHVMGIAAGSDLAGGLSGVAPESDLVFVQIANKGTSGLANLGDSVRILEAIDFIDRVSAGRPWVINLSMGKHGGPHDGCTLVEMALDFIIQSKPGCFIVQSCGNYYQRDTHASGQVDEGEIEELVVLVDKPDRTPNELEIWYSSADVFDVQVLYPDGTQTDWVRLGEQVDLLASQNLIGRLYHRDADPNNHDHHIDLFLYPQAPPGIWTVRLRGVSISDGTFHAWLERDDACPTCQSRFSVHYADQCYTTGTIANGRLPLVVGAYNGHSRDRALASFSSSGPTRDGRTKPDLIAPGEAVLSARSASRAIRRSNSSLVRKSGTSMAAPHVTGAVALCLQASPRRLTALEIRELILENTDSVSVEENKHRYGEGYLNIERALAALNRSATKIITYSDYDKDNKVMNKYESLENVALASPEELYYQFVEGAEKAHMDEDVMPYSVVGLPGEQPLDDLRAGDILVRIALGEPGLGYEATLFDGNLWTVEELHYVSLKAESYSPGYYGVVDEKEGEIARRILDERGYIPQGQILLRKTDSEWDYGYSDFIEESSKEDISIDEPDAEPSESGFEWEDYSHYWDSLLDQSATGTRDVRFVRSRDARVRSSPPGLNYVGRRIPRATLVEVKQSVSQNGRSYVLATDVYRPGFIGPPHIWGWTLASNLRSNDASRLNWRNLKQAMVRLANAEFNAWNTPNPRFETNPATFANQRAYWAVVGLTNVSDAQLSNVSWQNGILGPDGVRRGGHAWSAAFISWVVQQAGAQDHFFYNASHSCYIVWARMNREVQYQDNPFWAYPINAPEARWPEKGDIICKNRSNGNYTLQSIQCGNSSHCDIVVQVDKEARVIVTVGGNVHQRVARRTINLNEQGYVDPAAQWQIQGTGLQGSQQQYFALIKVRTTRSTTSSVSSPTGSRSEDAFYEFALEYTNERVGDGEAVNDAISNAKTLSANAAGNQISTLYTKVSRQIGLTHPKLPNNPLVGVSDQMVTSAYNAHYFHGAKITPEILLAIWVKEGGSKNNRRIQQIGKNGFSAATEANARTIFRSLVYYNEMGIDEFIAYYRVGNSGDNKSYPLDDSHASKHETRFTDQVKRLQKAGYLSSDISKDINNALKVKTLDKGIYAVEPTTHFYIYSLLLTDALFREFENEAKRILKLRAKPDVGLTYACWNLGGPKFTRFIKSANKHRKEPAYEVNGKAPTLVEWAFERIPKSKEWPAPRLNAARLRYIVDVFKLVYSST